MRVPQALEGDAGQVLELLDVARPWASNVKKFEHLPRVTLKGLRHTHATILMELGVPPKVVQERLGHSTITTTMNIYSHVTPTMQKNAVEQFAGRLAGT